MASTGFLAQGGGILKILYLGVRNSIEGLESAAFTKVNHASTPAQVAANTTTADVTKLGCLAGSVAAVHGEAVLGAGNGPTDAIVGLFVNDLAGNAFESSSAAASEKGVYVNCLGTYEVGVYETANLDGASIMTQYQFGKPLYCSVNGFLTVAEGLIHTGGNAVTAVVGAVVVGIITKSPTSSDPMMRFNLRV